MDALIPLDVFASNPSACAWYWKAGYQPHGQSWLCRFLVAGAAPAAPCSIEPVQSAMEEALTAEKQFGFSHIRCKCGNQMIVIGLVEGHGCRLIHFDTAIEPVAAAALEWARSQQRQILIAWWPGLPSTAWPLVSTELSLRMVRPLNASRN
jgi:hypothetical protein